MVFTGTYEHAIDAKHRLAIPSDIRRELQRGLGTGEGDAVVLYCVLGGADVLCLYTEPGYHRLAEELRRSDVEPEALLAYEEVFYASSKRIDMDGAGRIRLPEHLLKQTGLSGEVVIAGAGDHLKIRDRGAWAQRLESVLQDQPNLLVNPRMMLGRNKNKADGN
ncbi:MAG: division/cell wall cluster transcriptional repressor MraZ [Phycisphaeraceae bacterium]